MKNTLLLVLFGLTLGFISCSKDDDDTTTTQPPVVTVVEDGTLVYTPSAKVDISSWSWKDATLSTGSTVTEVLSGDLTTDKTLNGYYQLPGSYVIKSGATLTIEAGTHIEAATATGTTATTIFLAVEAGGKIIINGTSVNPVVMSSVLGNAGDWGGLTIAGNATTTAGTDVTAEVSGIIYGGTNDADDSGSINYLVIRGTGAQIDEESQYNGISFFGVGSGTTVSNVAIIDGGDDGVEFFGGAVEASNLYLENNQDDSVDWTEGWSGGVSNVYVSHTIAGFSTVLEGDKDNGSPYFTGLTAISTVGGTALQFKKASGGVITSLYLEGYDLEFDIKDSELFVPDNVTIDGVVVKTTPIVTE